jgi:nicotinamide-nucleotide amidase
MKAEIIASGTEILLGEIVDTNTSFLAREMALLGIDVHFASSVGDNYDRFRDVLYQAWQRSNVIITTGGLGPTQGDITRRVIATVVGEEMYIDDDLKQAMMDYFNRMGVDMPENNLRQATLISSAKPLLNSRGTAPGWWVEKGRKTIIALPGPPTELQAMWRSQVVPRLRKRSGAIIISRVLKTWGLSEAKIDQMAAPFLSSPNPTVAIYARQEGVVLRITAKSASEESAREMLAVMEGNIRSVLGDHVWGMDDETIAGIVLRLLSEKGLTLAVCESVTGGFLAYTMASAMENATCFRGGMVVNTDESRSILGLESITGAEGVTAMASLARERLNADIGIGVAGDAGSPTDADLEKRAMLSKVFISINTGLQERDSVQDYRYRLDLFTRRATQQALFNLRALLLLW